MVLSLESASLAPSLPTAPLEPRREPPPVSPSLSGDPGRILCIPRRCLHSRSDLTASPSSRTGGLGSASAVEPCTLWSRNKTGRSKSDRSSKHTVGGEYNKEGRLIEASGTNNKINSVTLDPGDKVQEEQWGPKKIKLLMLGQSQ